MKKTFLTLMLVLILYPIATANTYYVTVNGNDSNAGTIGSPWGTWQKAFETANAGDTVYFRGGVWYPTQFTTEGAASAISPDAGIGHNGQPGNRICFFNYPGETPILDCKNLVAPPPNVYGDGNRYITGLHLSDVHWIHFCGLTIRNVYQREVNVRPRGILGWPISNMIFENMTIHNIGAEGWYLHSSVEVTGQGFGWDNSGYIPYDTTKFINCDTYQCCDTLPANIGNSSGNMGDGMKLISYPKAYLVWSGCRQWHCSDDGVDIPGSATKIFENCWSFYNNYPEYNFEGNGFKIGGNNDINVTGNVFRNNISAFNGGVGLYEVEYPDYVRTNARIYNNTIYKCNTGLSMSDNINYPSSGSIYKNNIVYGITGRDAINRPYVLDANFYYSESNNSWDYAESGSLPNWTMATDVTITDADFVLIDSVQGLAQLMAPRKSDGSLPDITFLKLAATSDLIDAGTNVGIPYNGNAPDIGAFEYGNSSGLSKISTDNVGFTISPTFVEEEAFFQFTGIHAGKFYLEIYNLSGVKVLETDLAPITPGTNRTHINLNTLEQGLYLCRLVCNKQASSTLKFVKK